MFSKVIFSRGSIRNKTSDHEFSVVFSETEITQQEDGPATKNGVNKCKRTKNKSARTTMINNGVTKKHETFGCFIVYSNNKVKSAFIGNEALFSNLFI